MHYYKTLIKYSIAVVSIYKFLLFDKKWSLIPHIKLYQKTLLYRKLSFPIKMKTSFNVIGPNFHVLLLKFDVKKSNFILIKLLDLHYCNLTCKPF